MPGSHQKEVDSAEVNIRKNLDSLSHFAALVFNFVIRINKASENLIFFSILQVMHLLHKMVPETAVLISTDLVFGLHYWNFRSAYSSVTQQVSPTTHFYLMTSGCCLCDRGPKISYQTLGSSETRNCVCVCVAMLQFRLTQNFFPKDTAGTSPSW